jgi:hypothetical protein
MVVAHVFSTVSAVFLCTKIWICLYTPDDSAVYRALSTSGPSCGSCFVSLIWFLEFWGGFQIFGQFLDPSVKICWDTLFFCYVRLWRCEHTHSWLFNRCSDRVQFDSNIIAPIHASSLSYVRLGVIFRALVESIYVCLTSLQKHEFVSLHHCIIYSAGV